MTLKRGYTRAVYKGNSFSILVGTCIDVYSYSTTVQVRTPIPVYGARKRSVCVSELTRAKVRIVACGALRVGPLQPMY